MKRGSQQTQQTVPSQVVEAALSPLQRQRCEALKELMGRVRREVLELTNGYSLRYAEGGSTWRLLAEWVDLERRHCPFLHFGLEKNGDGVWLHVTAEPELKPFLADHLGLQRGELGV